MVTFMVESGTTPPPQLQGLNQSPSPAPQVHVPGGAVAVVVSVTVAEPVITRHALPAVPTEVPVMVNIVVVVTETGMVVSAEVNECVDPSLNVMVMGYGPL